MIKNQQPHLNVKLLLSGKFNGELSSYDIARITNALSIRELRECELACNRVNRDIKNLNLGMWW